MQYTPIAAYRAGTVQSWPYQLLELVNEYSLITTQYGRTTSKLLATALQELRMRVWGDHYPTGQVLPPFIIGRGGRWGEGMRGEGMQLP